MTTKTAKYAKTGKSFEDFAPLREIFGINGKFNPYKAIPKTKNERLVFEVAMETVGGVENSVLDGVWDAPVIYDDLVAMAMDDVFEETPREARFVGRGRALELCQIAAALYEA